MRCLEFYSGIGGFSVVAQQFGWTVTQSYDINQNAAEVYRLNFPFDHQVRTIESIPFDELAEFAADLWCVLPVSKPEILFIG